MKRIALFTAPLLALAVVLTYTKALRAADAPAATTATLNVTVTDKDGKPVEGATVRVTQSKSKADKSANSCQNLADTGSTGAKPPPVAEAKTADDGKVKLENIPAGSYNLSANLKGTGYARKKITLKAGETQDIALQLAPRQPK